MPKEWNSNDPFTKEHYNNYTQDSDLRFFVAHVLTDIHKVNKQRIASRNEPTGNTKFHKEIVRTNQNIINVTSKPEQLAIDIADVEDKHLENAIELAKQRK